ncbi:aspartic peptidase domain-containing protein [Mycena filopes]|nr:aspartic peptidase domain-containing protein [Mycena filopes]
MFIFSLLFFSTQALLAFANGRNQQPTGPVSTDTIFSDNDIRYTASLVVGGQTINVTLDTGSTDMWLNPYQGVGTFEDTGVWHKISYADGTPYINGTIGLVEVSIAGHTIPRQAFINVTDNVGEDQCGHGVCGLIGLGFDNPNVGIQKALTDAGKDGVTLGKSVLSSIFDQNPDKGRFFTISLSRKDDPQGSPDAFMTIAEYKSGYEIVAAEPKHAVYPPGEKNWNLLSDGIFVNGRAIPYQATNSGALPGTMLVGLDTGNPGITVRGPAIRDQIYSQIPGAVLAKNSTIPNVYWHKDDNDIWVIPCNASVEVSVNFDGTPYTIHPLDLTALRTRVHAGVAHTVCVNSITNGGDQGRGKDVLYGDPFLRSVYTVYDFGNATTPAFVQFLPRVDYARAAQDFANVRRKQLASAPPELSPADFVHLYDGPSAGIPATPLPGCPAQVAHGNLLASDVSSSTDGDNSPAKYGPAIVGLLGANLLLLLALLAFTLLQFMRGRSSGRTHTARYAPVHIKEFEARQSLDDKL